MKAKFTIRTVLIATACLCCYLALAAQYGFGRGLLCLTTLLQGLTSIVFFVAAYHSMQEEHPRNALASSILGCLILIGSILLGIIVFQPIAKEDPSAFDRVPQVSKPTTAE